MPFSHYYGLWKNIPHCLTQIQMGLAGRLRLKSRWSWLGAYISPSKKSPLDPPSPWSWLGAYVTTNHEYHSTLLLKVLEVAKKRYLLADRSKFNRSGLFRLGVRADFDRIISD